jgi:hypothetical protein
MKEKKFNPDFALATLLRGQAKSAQRAACLDKVETCGINNRGVAFVTAIVLMVLFLNLGLGYLMMARTQLMIARNQISTLKAFYHSESALQHSIAELVNNVDKDADGLGNIPLQDLDGDGSMDYSATYNSATGTVSSTGNTGTDGIVRTIETKMTPKKWTGAFMAGLSIPAVSNCDFSTVTGNVFARSAITPNFTTQHTVTGTVTQGYASLAIPTTITSPGGPWFSYAPAANRHVNCLWVTPASSTITGVHYVNGACTINLGGSAPLTINGSLIVNGNLSISQVTSLMITPAGKDPALVASGTLSLGNVSPGVVNIHGLIYAGGNISLTIWNFFPTPRHSINGAIVSGVGTISMATIARTDWVFDSSLNPPFFTGGSPGYSVDYWKGHK